MRIAIFVDGSNLYYLSKTLNWTVDLKKLVAYYNSVGEVTDAYYYAATDGYHNPFLDSLPRLGFVLISKPLKTVGFGDDAHRKGNMDIEIVLDMFNTIDTYDMAVLVSGDGDFKRVLELLRARGKRFQVLSHPLRVAKELLQVAGMHYVNIATLENTLKYSSTDAMSEADIDEIFEDMADFEEQYPI